MQTARSAIYDNYTVTTPAIAGSATAISVLRASSQYATRDLQRQETKNFNVYSGKCFILDWTMQYSMLVTLPNTLGGATTIGDSITTHNVMRFATALSGTSNYGGTSGTAGNIVTYFKI